MNEIDAAFGAAPTRLARPRLFITGASGFIASHFLLALHERRPSEVFALLRAADAVSASEKLRAALRCAAESYRAARDQAGALAATTSIVGDILLPACGVAPALVESIVAGGTIDEFWHFAASLNFEERARDAIMASNLGGAEHAVALAGKLGARRFVYVSTAYSAGSRAGRVPEALHDRAGPFNNRYEESKCAAEHLVTQLCAAAGIALTILRPSIVVGPSETKLTGGTKTGLYGFIRELARLASAVKSWDGEVRMLVNPQTSLNLIPVDWFVEDALQVAARNFETAPIVHSTASVAPPVGPCLRKVASRLGLSRLQFCEQEAADFSPLEKLLDRRVAFYRSYLMNDKQFDRSLPGRWEVNLQDFQAYVAEGIRELRRESVTSIFARDVVTSFDGSPLSVYSCGDPAATPLVLANAMGMPAGFWTRLAARLGKRYRIVTWETRGTPSFFDAFAERDCSIDTHVRDLLAVMSAHDMQSAHLAGWCSGALVALKAAWRAPERVRSLVLLNGSYSLGPEVARTQFESNMRLVMPKIAASRRTAELFYRTIYLPKRTGAQDEQERDATARTDQLLMSADPDLIHLTSAPFDSVDTLQRYGRLIAAAFEDDAARWAGEVETPALIVSGERDISEHPDGSRAIAQLVRRSILRVYPDVDHFGLFNSEDVGAAVEEFLGCSARTLDEADVDRQRARFEAGAALRG